MLKYEVYQTLFKVNRCTFMGSKSAIFIFMVASLLNGSQILKERICSSRSKFFPLRVDSTVESYVVKGGNPAVKKVVPLCKDGGKNAGLPIHLKTLQLCPTSGIMQWLTCWTTNPRVARAIFPMRL